MILFKKIVKPIIIGVIITAWAFGVYDINSRLPKPDELVYTKEQPACIEGLEIVPLSNKIYTLQEFKAAYPEGYEEWENPYMSEADRFIVYELQLTNTNDYNIYFDGAMMEAFESTTCFANGCSGVENKISMIINAGEAMTYRISTYIIKSAMSRADRESLKKENFGLNFGYYPELIMFRFD